MSVTLIAEKAGVSIATVSRVLNNSRPVKPEIAAAVRRAAEELNLPVRPPRKRRSRGDERQTNIAIVSVGQAARGWFDVPVIASVVAELSRAAQDLEMGVLITEMPSANELSPVLRRPDTDGAIVFITSSMSTRDIATLRQQMPVVRVMGGQVAPTEIDHVGADNNAIGYLAGAHLLDQGLTRVAFMTNRPSWDFIRMRGQGFMAAMQDRGVIASMYLEDAPDRPRCVFGPNPIVEPSVERLAQRIAQQPGEGKIGLFVPRDEETAHAYRALRDAGLEPGRDVVVVSCDNEQVRLSSLHPRPATIDLGAAEIARRAVRRLAYRIKHRDDPPVRILVSPHLVEGSAQ